MDRQKPDQKPKPVISNSFRFACATCGRKFDLLGSLIDHAEHCNELYRYNLTFQLTYTRPASSRQ